VHEVTSGVLTGAISGVVRSLWHCEEHAELDETVLPTTGGMVVITLDRHLRAVDVRVRRPGAAPADVISVVGRRSIGIELVPGSWPLVGQVVSQLVPTPFAGDPSEAGSSARSPPCAPRTHPRSPPSPPMPATPISRTSHARACSCAG